MQIYIDESGAFVPPAGQAQSLSCVAALVVPSTQREHLLREFTRLRTSWGSAGSEVKGSKLIESQVAAVVALLRSHDVLLEICGVEIGGEDQEAIEEHKREQAERIVANVTPEHAPGLVGDLNQMKNAMLALSNQLYVQAWATWTVIQRTLQTATLYYCQRRPEELGAFHWVVDAKDVGVTPFESLWHAMVMPAMEMWSLKESPYLELKGGDYTHFKRFLLSYEKPPDYLKPFLKDAEAPLAATDIGLIMREHFSFKDSDEDPGLQLADILANAVRRAFHGKLGRAGWEHLGSLIVGRRRQPITMISLSGAQRMRWPHQSRFGAVMMKLRKKFKSMFPRGTFDEPPP